MDLDDHNAALEPFSSCRMISAAEYTRSLCIPGGFNWHRAVHTVLVHFKLAFLLPAADLLVRGDVVSGQDVQDVDAFGPLGGSAFVYLALRDALSPLHLYSIGASSKWLPSVLWFAAGPMLGLICWVCFQM
jgi:hypothetical protein